MEKNGVTWYYYLAKDHAKKSLFDHEYIDTNTFVVRHEGKNNQFAAFPSPSHFFLRYKETHIEHKTFYEVIHREQKPYFDVDIDDVSVDGDQLIKDLYIALKSVIEQTFMFMVFTSHTKTKKSYHVVLADVYLSDHHEMKNLFQAVMAELKNPNKQYIDSNVYKSTQQLRLLGSQKFNKNNTKVICEELTENYFIPVERRTMEAKQIYDFKLSLVSDVTGCAYLCGFHTVSNATTETMVNESEVKVVTKDSIETHYGDLIKQVNQLIYLHFDNVDFSVEQIKDDTQILIIMRSNSPYYCNLCKSVHENENPYIFVNRNNEVYFNCRRYDNNGKNKKNGNVLLGKLKPVSCNALINS